MFKLFLFIGLFSTIFCASLVLSEIKPEFSSLKKTINEDILSLNDLLPTTSSEKCKNTPIILRTLELIMSIMNQNMERQAHTTYILNLLIKIIEKNTESFSLKEQEVMNKVLEALENYQGPTFQGHSGLRSERKPPSKGLTNAQKSYCADALLKISQIASDAYNKLTNEPLDYEDSNTLSQMLENLELPWKDNNQIPFDLKGISPYAVNNNEQPSNGALSYILGPEPKNRLKHSSAEIHKTRTTAKQNMSPEKEIKNIRLPPGIQFEDVATKKMVSVNEVPIQNHLWHQKHDHHKQLGINDIEPTTRRLMKEIFDLDTHTPKPRKEIRISQYNYPSSNNSLEIEVVTTNYLGGTTESSHSSYLNQPYNINKKEYTEHTTKSPFKLKYPHFTHAESPNIANKKPSYGSHIQYLTDAVTTQKNNSFSNDNFENWQPNELVVPIKVYFENLDDVYQTGPNFEYIRNIEHPLNQINQNNYQGPHHYSIIKHKNPWSHEVQDKPITVNGVISDSSQNHHQPIGYENSPWALEIEIPTETPLHDNNIFSNNDLLSGKNLFLGTPTLYPVANEVHTFGENWYPNPISQSHNGYVSIQDLTGPDNDKFWAYDTYLWNMGIELPEIDYSKIPTKQVVNANGFPILPSAQPLFYQENEPEGDVEFINALPENLVNEPPIEEDWIPEIPFPIEEEVDSSTELALNDQPQNIIEVSTKKVIDEEYRSTRTTTPIPTDNFLDQDSGYHWPYYNSPKYEIEQIHVPNRLPPKFRPIIVNNFVVQKPGEQKHNNRNPSHYWAHHQNPSEFEIEVTTKGYISMDQVIDANQGDYWLNNLNPGQHWFTGNQNPVDKLPFNHQNPSGMEEIEVTTENFMTVHQVISANPGHYWSENQHPDYYWPRNHNSLDIEITTKTYISSEEIDSFYDWPYDQNYDNNYLPYVQNPDYNWSYDQYPSAVEMFEDIDLTPKRHISVDHNIDSHHAYNILPLPAVRPALIDQNPGHYWPYNQNPDYYWPYSPSDIEIEDIEITTKSYISVDHNIDFNPAYNVLPLPTAGHHWPYKQNPGHYWPYHQNSPIFEIEEIELTTKRHISDDEVIYSNQHHWPSEYYWLYDQNPSHIETEETNVLPLPSGVPVLIEQNPGHFWPHNKNPDHNWPYNNQISSLDVIEATTKRTVVEEHRIPEQEPVTAYNVLPLPTKIPFVINSYDFPYSLNSDYYWPYNHNPLELEIEMTTKKHIQADYNINKNPPYNVLPLSNIIDQIPGNYWHYNQNPDHYWPYNQNPSELEIEEIEVTTKRYISDDHNIEPNPVYNVLPSTSVKLVLISQNRPQYYWPYNQYPEYNWPYNRYPSELETEEIAEVVNSKPSNPHHYRPYVKNPLQLEIKLTTKKHIHVDHNINTNPAYNVLPLPTERPNMNDRKPGNYWPYNETPDYNWPYNHPSESEFVEIEVTTKRYISVDYNKDSNPAYNVLPLPIVRPVLIDQNPGYYRPYNQNHDYYWPYRQYLSEHEIEEIEVTTKSYISVDYDIQSNPAYNVSPLPTVRPISIDQNPGHYRPYNQNPSHYWLYHQNPSQLEIEEVEVTTKTYHSADEVVNSNPAKPHHYRPYVQNPLEFEIEVTTKKHIHVEYNINTNPAYNVLPLPTVRPNIFDQISGHYWPYNQNPNYNYPLELEIEGIDVTTKQYISVDETIHSNPHHYRPSHQNPSEIEIEVTTIKYESINYNIHSNPAHNVLFLTTVRPLFINQNSGHYRPYNENPSETENSVHWANDQNQDYNNWSYDLVSNDLEPYDPNSSGLEIQHPVNIDPAYNVLAAVRPFLIDQNPGHYWPYNQNPSEIEIEVTTKRYITIDHEINSNPAYNWLPMNTMKPLVINNHVEQKSDHYWPHHHNPSELEIELTTKRYISIDYNIDSDPSHYRPYNQKPGQYLPNELEIEVTTKRVVLIKHENEPIHGVHNWLYNEVSTYYVPYQPVKPSVEDFIQINPANPSTRVTTQSPFVTNYQNPLELDFFVTTKPHVLISDGVGHNSDNFYDDRDLWKENRHETTKIPFLNYDHIGDNPNQHWNYDLKQWDLEIEVPTVSPALYGHLVNEDPGYILNYNQHWNQHPETITNRYLVTNGKGHINPNYHINAYKYWNQPHKISTQGYITIDDIAGPHPDQIWTTENILNSNYVTSGKYIVSTYPGYHISTKHPIIQNNRPHIFPNYENTHDENYFLYDLYETTTEQPLPANPVLTDINYYPWGHNVQTTTVRADSVHQIFKNENSYPKADINGQLELQHEKWIGDQPNKGYIKVSNKGQDINIVHKPDDYENIDDDDTSVENIGHIDINNDLNTNQTNKNHKVHTTKKVIKETIKVTEVTTPSSTASLESLETVDSIFLNSEEVIDKAVEQSSSNMIPISEKLVTENNMSFDPESIHKPSWNFADNGALILTDPIEIPSNDDAASSEVNSELTDIDIDDNVETETQVINLIQKKLHEVEKRAKTENELRILNLITTIRQLISEELTKDTYLNILTYYNEINNYLKTDSKSKINFIISRLYDLPDQNNLELDSQDNVVEMTYLVRRPKPTVIYPYYYIKYKIRVDKIDELVKDNPELIDDHDNLHLKLLKTSEIAEKSPALQNVSEQDLLTLTIDHGDVIETKLVSNSTDKKLFLPDDFEDENTVYTREKNNLRNKGNQPTSFNTLNGDIHLTIKQNDKPYNTISIEDRHFPIEEINDDQLNDLKNPFRKLFPLYKLKQATDNASGASRQGYNSEATKYLEDYYKSLLVKPLPKKEGATSKMEKYNSTNADSTPSDLDTDKT